MLNSKLTNEEFLTSLAFFGFARQATSDLFQEDSEPIPHNEQSHLVAITLREQINRIEEDRERTIQTLYNTVFTMTDSQHRSNLISKWLEWMTKHFKPYTEVWAVLKTAFPRHQSEAASIQKKELPSNSSNVTLDRGKILYTIREQEEMFFKVESPQSHGTKTFGPHPSKYSPNRKLHISPDGQKILIPVAEIQNGVELINVSVMHENGSKIYTLPGCDFNKNIYDFLDNNHLLVSINGSACIVDIRVNGRKLVISDTELPRHLYCVSPDSSWFALLSSDKSLCELRIYQWDGDCAKRIGYRKFNKKITLLKSLTTDHIGWRDNSDSICILNIRIGEELPPFAQKCSDFVFDKHSERLFWINSWYNKIYFQGISRGDSGQFDLGLTFLSLWTDGNAIVALHSTSYQYMDLSTIERSWQQPSLDGVSYLISCNKCDAVSNLFAVATSHDIYVGEFGKNSKLFTKRSHNVNLLKFNKSKTLLFLQDMSGQCIIMDLKNKQEAVSFPSSFDDMVWSDKRIVGLQGSKRLVFMNESGSEIELWPSPCSCFTPSKGLNLLFPDSTVSPRENAAKIAEYLKGLDSSSPELTTWLKAIQEVSNDLYGQIIQCAVVLDSTKVSYIQIYSLDGKGQETDIPFLEITMSGGNCDVYLYWPYVLIRKGNTIHVHKQTPDCRKVNYLFNINNIYGSIQGVMNDESPLLISLSNNLCIFYSLATGTLCGKLPISVGGNPFIAPIDRERLAIIENTNSHKIYKLLQGGNYVPNA